MRKKDNVSIEKEKWAVRIALRIMLIVVLAFLILAVFLAPTLDLYSVSVADKYSGDIFPYIALVGNSVSNVFFTSLTEMFVVVGVLAVLSLLVLFIMGLVKSIRERKVIKYLYRILVALLIIGLWFSTSYQLMHGLNYKRTPVTKKLELSGGKRSSEEVMAVQLWAYTNMIEARSRLGSDYNGVAHMQTGLPETVLHANEILESVNNKYDLEMSSNIIRVKPVMLSKYWYYTGIVGVYDPFLGESNINVETMMPHDFPLTVCHEEVHAKGYARENDANFIATIACCLSVRPDFRYAGYYKIFMSTVDLLDNYDSYAGREDFAPVLRDMQADYAHWIKFQDGLGEKINEMSEAANDAFLEANGQEGGTDTYIVDTNSFVEFYYKYVENGGKD